VVAELGPGVGEEDEDPGDAGVGQGGEQEAGVVHQDADIGEPPLLDEGEEAGDAVEEGLDADQANLGVGLGLGGEVLAAAETDLEPERPRRVEQGGRIEPLAWGWECDAQLGQALLQERTPAGAELRALPPSPDLPALRPAAS
jgi:hypothetical protein